MTTEAEAPDNIAEKKAKLIPIAQVKKSKPDPKLRTFSKKSAQEIADSVKAKGLIYPIILRPLPEPEGEVLYEIVAGTHRFYACGHILQWETIPAHVMKMDDDDCLIYRIVENAARNSLSQEQFFAQIAQWRKIHVAKNKVGAAGSKAAAEIRTAKAKGEAPPARKSEAKPKESESNIQEMVAHATGKSVTSAKTDIAIAGALDKLTAEQKAVVFPEDKEAAPSKKSLAALSKLTPKGMADAITLRASGMDWDEAISQGEKRVPKSAKPADPTKQKSEADLTDEEYLDTTCGTRLTQLKKKSVFKSDALLYRKWVRIRKRIQRDTETLLKEVKAAGHRGPLHLMIERAMRVKHPNEWSVCGTCGGNGKKKDSDEPCGGCNGAAYKVTVEPL